MTFPQDSGPPTLHCPQKADVEPHPNHHHQPAHGQQLINWFCGLLHWCHMEVRRRRAGGTRDDSESRLVDVHPQDPRSQWSISQREQQEGEADSDYTMKIKSSISNALVSLGDNTFINFIINMVRQTIQLFYGSVPPQQLDEHTRFCPPPSNLFLRCLLMSFHLLYPKEPL